MADSAALARALWQFQSTPSGAAVGNPSYVKQGIKSSPWHREFANQFGESPDLNITDYDYQAAWQAGIRPERDVYDGGKYHWPSSLPSGEMLKSANHPTAWKEHYMRATGVNPDAIGATLADWEKLQNGR